MRSSWAALILRGFDEGLGFAISEIQLYNIYIITYIVWLGWSDVIGTFICICWSPGEQSGRFAIKSLWLLQVKGQWEVGLLDSDFVVPL